MTHIEIQYIRRPGLALNFESYIRMNRTVR